MECPLVPPPFPLSCQGVFQVGDDVQTGSAPVFAKGMIGGLYSSAVAGSWFWHFVLTSLKSMIIWQLSGAAKKAEKQNLAEAAAAAAAPAS